MSIAAMESRCEFPWLASGIAFVLSSFGGRADACSMSATLDLGDIQYAHVVVVRAISEIFSNTSPDRAAAWWWAVGSSGNFGRSAGPWPISRGPSAGQGRSCAPMCAALRSRVLLRRRSFRGGQYHRRASRHRRVVLLDGHGRIEPTPPMT